MCAGGSGEALQSILEPLTPGREEDGFQGTPPRDVVAGGRTRGSAASAAPPGSNSGLAAAFSARARPLCHAEPGLTHGGAAVVPLWQQALNHASLNVPKIGVGGGAAGRPGTTGRGACRRANSVASSINSLDSLVVD